MQIISIKFKYLIRFQKGSFEFIGKKPRKHVTFFIFLLILFNVSSDSLAVSPYPKSEIDSYAQEDSISSSDSETESTDFSSDMDYVEEDSSSNTEQYASEGDFQSETTSFEEEGVDFSDIPDIKYDYPPDNTSDTPDFPDDNEIYTPAYTSSSGTNNETIGLNNEFEEGSNFFSGQDHSNPVDSGRSGIETNQSFDQDDSSSSSKIGELLAHFYHLSLKV